MSNIIEDKKSSISNIIDALTKIENNHLNSNRNNAIYSMLKEIGLYTKALYVSMLTLVLLSLHINGDYLIILKVLITT
jgi:hypothetical protein